MIKPKQGHIRNQKDRPINNEELSKIIPNKSDALGPKEWKKKNSFRRRYINVK